MKRLFTLIPTICFCSLILQAQAIFSTEFTTEDEFKAWSVTDANADGSTWSFDNTAEPSHVFYSYNSANAADDWMISPAITSDKSGTLAISFTTFGSSYGEKIEAFYGEEGTVEAMTNRLCEPITLAYDTETHLYLVEVEAGKPIFLGLHACSDADKWRIYLCKVEAQFSENPVDIQASALTSPISGFGLAQETVTVTVKNSGTVDVESFDLSFSIDDTLVATETVNQPLAAGAEMEYTFNTKADLSEARKLFNLKAWTTHPDDVNPANDACTLEVLHKAPATIPYAMGFEADEYTDGIVTYNLNEDSGNWDVYTDPWWNLARTGDYCLAYNYDSDNNADDWAILEPITIEEDGYYVLKFWYSGDDTHPEKLGVYYGNEGTPEAMTNTIVEYAPFARSAYEESINIIYLDRPQTLYIGFHAFSNKDENWICIDDVSLEKVSSETIDLAVYGITNPGDFMHTGSDNVIKFKVRSLGITDTNAKITAKIDDTTVYEETIEVPAQAIINMELKDILATLSEGAHTLTIEASNADDTALDNNSVSKEFRVMGTPVVRWDFEDGQIPSDFVFRSEDEGTINPGAGAEFNEFGWGVFNIQEHQLYGEYMFAGTSWLDGTEQADRWCVLPAIVPSADSYLVWDAASFNPKFLESYSIMVSTNGDDSWYYFTEKEFVAESAEFKTRGVDLSFYAEKETYVAFRLRSKNCEHLILDNIEFHGGRLGVVNNINTDDLKISVFGKKIAAEGTAINEITLYDMSGRCVAQATGNTISTEGLTQGIYIVRVIAEGVTTTQKVVIK